MEDFFVGGPWKDKNVGKYKALNWSKKDANSPHLYITMKKDV